MRTNSGFTLIELMIVVAIIATIVAIALPHLQSSKKVANETAAISTLRMFMTAQEVYSTKWGGYATASQLGAARMVDALMATALKDVPLEKSGYKYELDVRGNQTGWCAIAYPVNVGKTGDRSFYISTDGNIKFYLPAEGAGTPVWTQGTYTEYVGS